MFLERRGVAMVCRVYRICSMKCRFGGGGVEFVLTMESFVVDGRRGAILECGGMRKSTAVINAKPAPATLASFAFRTAVVVDA